VVALAAGGGPQEAVYCRMHHLVPVVALTGLTQLYVNKQHVWVWENDSDCDMDEADMDYVQLTSKVDRRRRSGGS
jgi:hypothetical protein